LRHPLLLCACVFLSGCTAWQPSVRPYERDHLTDPLMRWDDGDFSHQRRREALDRQEGARGATGQTDDIRGRP